jgi:hypothetical protein
MKMATPKLKTKPAKSKLIPIHIKLTEKEFAELKKRANWWALGNLSAWLRYAGLEHTPTSTENVSKAIAEKKR